MYKRLVFSKGVEYVTTINFVEDTIFFLYIRGTEI